MERVVVTGMGCISSLGHDVEAFTDALFNDNSVTGIRPITLFDPKHLSTKVAAQVDNFDVSNYFSTAEAKQLDRYSQFALVATQEAIKQSGIKDIAVLGARAAVVYGTGVGGQQTTEESYQQLYRNGKLRAHPFTVPKLIPSAAASHISMKYGITGPAFATSSACASSGHAIATAVMMIRSGLVDVAVVGGAEACITEGNFLAWEGLRVLSRDTCRPFSANRSGLIIGEGAATLILESEAFAKARKAKILAILAGIGMSSDAHNIVQPHIDGAISAMQACLHDANKMPEYVQYINAHGSGTKQNDITETQAIRHLFKEHAESLLVSSTKSQHGHVLGAGAAIEAIACILALKHQKAPATMNYQQADPECNLHYVENKPQLAQINFALSNSFAFGGLNTTLAFEQYL